MCLKPNIIYNRANFLNPVSSVQMTVPCGHCEECKDYKRLEYKVRGFYEWQDTIKKGGFAYFETLTYNNESFTHSERKFHGIKCFRYEDIRLFLKKLRKRCAGKFTFRYFLSSEYGGLWHRPHYHVIFYIIPTFPQEHLTQIQLLYMFRQYVLDSWTEPRKNIDGENAYFIVKGRKIPLMRSLGFIDSITTLKDRLIDRVAGISYVSKYVTKDQDFVDRVKTFHDNYIKDNGLIKDTSEYNVFEDEYKRCLPFHLQSQGFGGSILPYLESIADEIIKFPKICNLAIDSSAIDLPRYYLRKLFYTCEKSGTFSPTTGKPLYTYRPTALGEKFLDYQLDKRIDKQLEKYENALLNFDKYLDNEFTIKDVDRLLDGRPLRDFIVYKSVFKGHLFDLPLADISKLDYHDFYRKSRECGSIENYMYYDNPDESPEYCKSVRDTMRKDLSAQQLLCDVSPDWYNYDFIDSIFQSYFEERNNYISNGKETLRKINSRLKLFKQL